MAPRLSHYPLRQWRQWRSNETTGSVGGGRGRDTECGGGGGVDGGGGVPTAAAVVAEMGAAGAAEVVAATRAVSAVVADRGA